MVQEAPLKIYARGVVSYFYFSRAPRARAENKANQQCHFKSFRWCMDPLGTDSWNLKIRLCRIAPSPAASESADVDERGIIAGHWTRCALQGTRPYEKLPHWPAGPRPAVALMSPYLRRSQAAVTRSGWLALTGWLWLVLAAWLAVKAGRAIRACAASRPRRIMLCEC